jgi:hypothetical protein
MTLQCKDDQRHHLFSLLLGSSWWTQQVLWSLGILQPAMLFLRLVARYAIHSHPLHRLIIQEQLRLYDCPHYSCFCWVMHGLLTVTSFASSRIGQSPHAVVSGRYLPFGLLSCCVALQRPCYTTMSSFRPAIMLCSTSAAMLYYNVFLPACYHAV